MSAYLEFGSRHDYFSVEIKPTSRCNYNCYYCTTNRNNNNPILKLNTANIKTIINTARKYTKKQIYVYIVGGEPTLYPHLVEMVNDICEVFKPGDVCEIQSNLSVNIKWLEKFTASIHNLDYLRFSASYHNLQCKSLKEFIKKCAYLNKKDILGAICVMYNRIKDVKTAWSILENNFKDKVELSFLIEATLMKMTVNSGEKMARCVTQEVEYINENEDLEHFKKISPWYFEKVIPYKTEKETGLVSRYEMWLHKKNNFSGHRCEIEKDVIMIDFFGDCYTCPNDLFSDVPAVLNIQSESFDCEDYFKKINSRICPYSFCNPCSVIAFKKGPLVDPNVEMVVCNE